MSLYKALNQPMCRSSSQIHRNTQFQFPNPPPPPPPPPTAKMPFTLLLFVHRKPDVSPEFFKIEYEKHIEHVKRLAWDTFPLTHKRTYIARTTVDTPPEGASERNALTPATVFAGKQSDYDYDVMAEVTFVDKAGFEAFWKKTSLPEAEAELRAHEKEFMDAKKFGVVVVGDLLMTEGN
ncbi:hypothetical protein BO71DRAFT_401262 [Aspergillus ellipticus CBS 707.79]|uniref:EthD domain-containing protein n=1 Tax=Aspergillus ellipticus CBS 707.79 TaxID=1448320 RepID=A0A319D338_9EURO|nr:hypothetical protein BO71DRAFT_401262 [Aspergillus ellipticus CBS 707.79]